jgi:hypothetical protein
MEVHVLHLILQDHTRTIRCSDIDNSSCYVSILLLWTGRTTSLSHQGPRSSDAQNRPATCVSLLPCYTKQQQTATFRDICSSLIEHCISIAAQTSSQVIDSGKRLHIMAYPVGTINPTRTLLEDHTSSSSTSVSGIVLPQTHDRLSTGYLGLFTCNELPRSIISGGTTGG